MEQVQADGSVLDVSSSTPGGDDVGIYQAKLDADNKLKQKVESTTVPELIDRLREFVEHLPAEITAEYHAILNAIDERW